MAKHKETSHRQAYGDGYMAAIYRKPESSNPFEGGESRNEWYKGHDQGKKAVDFHAKSARRGSNPDISDLW
jgi:ribosome modulation factor